MCNTHCVLLHGCVLIECMDSIYLLWKWLHKDEFKYWFYLTVSVITVSTSKNDILGLTSNQIKVQIMVTHSNVGRL